MKATPSTSWEGNHIDKLGGKDRTESEDYSVYNNSSDWLK